MHRVVQEEQRRAEALAAWAVVRGMPAGSVALVRSLAERSAAILHPTDLRRGLEILLDAIAPCRRRRDGSPMVDHSLRVALAVIRTGVTAAEILIALLHDVLEDADPARRSALRRAIRRAFGREVLHGVLLLTKAESPCTALGKVRCDARCFGTLLRCGDPAVLRVKQADCADNADAGPGFCLRVALLFLPGLRRCLPNEAHRLARALRRARRTKGK
jgi:hypothetical protein